MADVIRIKRRNTGAAGAPAALANAELAYNEADHILYYGEGGTAGAAAAITPIAGQGLASNAAPSMAGAAAPGTATQWARGDHVHPTDTSRAPINSPAFTGIPTASTALPWTNSTQLATTAFVAATVASAGVTSFNLRTGAVTFQALDITNVGGALLVSPAFTGVPTAPTPANGDNTTQIATTQYVLGTRLDQLSAPTTNVNLNGQRIIGLADPSGPQDAATKTYVDSVAQGLDAKASVRAATNVNIALSGTQTIDGVALNVGDRILVKDQTTQSQNGIYVVATGAWARALDVDTWNELVSAYTFVEVGLVNADNGYVCTVDQGGALGVTAVTWVQFSGAGQVVAGAGLTKTGNTVDAVGTANRILVNTDNIDIDPNYVGQTSITTLGTIGTGTWNASTIAVSRGGTGATALNGYVKGSGTVAFTASPTIPSTDISGLTSSVITDFPEAVDDRVAALLAAGTNITLTYDDTANTLTIASTSGSTGASAPIKITSWSPAFDGANTVFTIKSSGSFVGITSATQLLVSVDGVMQEPLIDFNASGSQLTFAVAPTSDSKVWAVAFASIVASSPAQGAPMNAGAHAEGTTMIVNTDGKNYIIPGVGVVS